MLFSKSSSRNVPPPRLCVSPAAHEELREFAAWISDPWSNPGGQPMRLSLRRSEPPTLAPTTRGWGASGFHPWPERFSRTRSLLRTMAAELNLSGEYLVTANGAYECRRRTWRCVARFEVRSR